MIKQDKPQHSDSLAGGKPHYGQHKYTHDTHKLNNIRAGTAFCQCASIVTLYSAAPVGKLSAGTMTQYPTILSLLSISHYTVTIILTVS